MGHLINPVSLRLGVSRYWNSKWVASSSKYKYQFLFKSDWNIYSFLNRLFMRKSCIRAGLVFSHALFIRKQNMFNCIVFFWDGKSMVNMKSDVAKFFKMNSRHKIFYKLFIIYNFFRYKQNFNYTFKNIFKNLFLKYTLISKQGLYFFYQIVQKLQCKKLEFLPRDIYIYICYKLFNFFKIKSFNFILKKFYHLVFLKKIFFLRLEKLFKRLKKKFFFFKYLLSTRNKRILRRDNSVFLVKKIIEKFVNTKASGNLQRYNANVIMRPMTRLDMSSHFIGRYLAIRLRQRYRLLQALNPVFGDLKRNPIVEGYRINCSGRFTKKEIASFEWYRFGSVPLNTLDASVDYATIPFILKYSLCSFKVWLHVKKDKMLGNDVFKYLYRDFLFFNKKKRFRRHTHKKHFNLRFKKKPRKKHTFYYTKADFKRLHEEQKKKLRFLKKKNKFKFKKSFSLKNNFKQTGHLKNVRRVEFNRDSVIVR